MDEKKEKRKTLDLKTNKFVVRDTCTYPYVLRRYATSPIIAKYNVAKP